MLPIRALSAIMLLCLALCGVARAQSLGSDGMQWIGRIDAALGLTGPEQGALLPPDVREALQVLCGVLGSEDECADPDPASLAWSDLETAVLARVDAVKAARALAADAYDRARAALLAPLDGACGRQDDCAERLILALDRIGRETVALAERTDAALQDNALRHVDSRLTEVLHRVDVRAVLTALDVPGTGALLEPDASPRARLDAAMVLSRWLQAEIQNRFRQTLDPAGNALLAEVITVIDPEADLAGELRSRLHLQEESVRQSLTVLGRFGPGCGPSELPNFVKLEDLADHVAANLQGFVQTCGQAAGDAAAALQRVAQGLRAGVDPGQLGDLLCTLPDTARTDDLLAGIEPVAAVLDACGDDAALRQIVSDGAERILDALRDRAMGLRAAQVVDAVLREGWAWTPEGSVAACGEGLPLPVVMATELVLAPGGGELTAALSLRLCAQRPSNGTSPPLIDISDLGIITGEARIALSGVRDALVNPQTLPAAVEAALRDATLTLRQPDLQALANASQQRLARHLAGHLRRVLPDGLGLLLNPETVALAFEHEAAILRTEVRIVGEEVSVCVAFPLTHGAVVPDGCVTAQDAPQTLAQSLRTALEIRAKDAILAEIDETLRPLVGGIPDTVVLSQGVTVALEGVEDNLPGLSVRATVAASVWGSSVPLSGDLVMVIDREGQSHVVARPRLDMRALVRSQLGPAVAPMVTLSDAPGNCVDLAMAAGQPLQGRIGTLCWVDRRLTLDSPSDGVAAVLTAGGLRLSVGAVHAQEGALRIALRLSADPAQDRWDLGGNLAAMVEVRDGTFTLPADAEENAALYAHLRRQAARFLPDGARIAALELASDGIRLKLEGVGEALAGLALDALADPDTLAALSEGSATMRAAACEAAPAAVGVLLTQLALDKPVLDALDLCRRPREFLGIGQVQTLAGLLGDNGTGGVEWICQPRNTDANGTLRMSDCTLRLPDLEGVCDQMSLRLQPGGQMTPNGAEACLRSLVRPFVPDDLLSRIEDLRSAGLTLTCPGDNADLRQCALTARVTLPLSALNLGETCAQRPVSDPLVALRLGLDGRVRVDDGLDTFRDAITDALAAEASCRIAGLAQDALADVINRAREALASFDGQCEVGSGDPRALRFASCDAPLPDRPQVVRLSRTLDLLGETVTVQATFDLSDRNLTPRFTVACATCDETLNDVADRVAQTAAEVAGGLVGYEAGTARLSLSQDRLELRVPLSLTLPLGDTSAPLVLACTLFLSDSDLSCRTNDLLAIAVNAALEGLAPVTFDLGPFTASVNALTLEEDALRMAGTATFAPLGVQANLILRQPLSGGSPVVEELDGMQKDISSAIAEFLNSTLPIAAFADLEVVSVGLLFDGSGLPAGFRASSTAQFLSYPLPVPDVVLDMDGLRIEAPQALSVPFPPGTQIPVPPVTICPRSVTVGRESIILLTDVTVGECRASNLLSMRGTATLEFDPPSLSAEGALTLLRVLPLGRQEAQLDIGEQRLSLTTDLGGVLQDVIAYSAESIVTATHPPTARSSGDLRLFGTSVGQADVEIVLDGDGHIAATFTLDRLGLNNLSGSAFIDAALRNPSARIRGSTGIGRWTLGSFDAEAGMNRLRAAFSVLGIRLSVVVPGGLRALTPGLLEDAIKNLLRLNLEDLDEALKAILSGNITINPLSGFGSGENGAVGNRDGNGGGADGGGANGTNGGQPQGTDGTGGTGAPGAGAGAPQPPTGATVGDAGANVGAAEGLRPGLNETGRFSVRFEEDQRTIAWFDGLARQGTIAVAPDHPVTQAVRGHPEGALAFSSTTYAHRLQMRVEPGLGTCGETGDVIYLFSGESGRIGYLEECRLSGQIDAFPDLARPFLAGLAALPGARPDLIGDPQDILQRVLLSGHIGPVDGTPLAVALLAPGVALVTASLPTGGTCGDPGSATGPAEMRTLLVRDARLDQALDTAAIRTIVLPILSAVAGCETQVAWVEADGARLVTADTLATAQEGGELAPVQTRTDLAAPPEVHHIDIPDVAAPSPTPGDMTPVAVPVDYDAGRTLPTLNANGITPSDTHLARDERTGSCRVVSQNTLRGLQVFEFPASAFADGSCGVGAALYIVGQMPGRMLALFDPAEDEQILVLAPGVAARSALQGQELTASLLEFLRVAINLSGQVPRFRSANVALDPGTPIQFPSAAYLSLSPTFVAGQPLWLYFGVGAEAAGLWRDEAGQTRHVNIQGLIHPHPRVAGLIRAFAARGQRLSEGFRAGDFGLNGDDPEGRLFATVFDRESSRLGHHLYALFRSEAGEDWVYNSDLLLREINDVPMPFAAVLDAIGNAPERPPLWIVETAPGPNGTIGMLLPSEPLFDPCGTGHSRPPAAQARLTFGEHTVREDYPSPSRGLLFDDPVESTTQSLLQATRDPDRTAFVEGFDLLEDSRYRKVIIREMTTGDRIRVVFSGGSCARPDYRYLATFADETTVQTLGLLRRSGVEPHLAFHEQLLPADMLDAFVAQGPFPYGSDTPLIVEGQVLDDPTLPRHWATRLGNELLVLIEAPDGIRALRLPAEEQGAVPVLLELALRHGGDAFTLIGDATIGRAMLVQDPNGRGDWLAFIDAAAQPWSLTHWLALSRDIDRVALSDALPALQRAVALAGLAYDGDSNARPPHADLRLSGAGVILRPDGLSAPAILARNDGATRLCLEGTPGPALLGAMLGRVAPSDRACTEDDAPRLLAAPDGQAGILTGADGISVHLCNGDTCEAHAMDWDDRETLPTLTAALSRVLAEGPVAALRTGPGLILIEREAVQGQVIALGETCVIGPVPMTVRGTTDADTLAAAVRETLGTRCGTRRDQALWVQVTVSGISVWLDDQPKRSTTRTAQKQAATGERVLRQRDRSLTFPAGTPGALMERAVTVVLDLGGALPSQIRFEPVEGILRTSLGQGRTLLVRAGSGPVLVHQRQFDVPAPGAILQAVGQGEALRQVWLGTNGHVMIAEDAAFRIWQGRDLGTLPAVDDALALRALDLIAGQNGGSFAVTQQEPALALRLGDAAPWHILRPGARDVRLWTNAGEPWGIGDLPTRDTVWALGESHRWIATLDGSGCGEGMRIVNLTGASLAGQGDCLEPEALLRLARAVGVSEGTVLRQDRTLAFAPSDGSRVSVLCEPGREPANPAVVLGDADPLDRLADFLALRGPQSCGGLYRLLPGPALVGNGRMWWGDGNDLAFRADDYLDHDDLPALAVAVQAANLNATGVTAGRGHLRATLADGRMVLAGQSGWALTETRGVGGAGAWDAIAQALTGPAEGWQLVGLEQGAVAFGPQSALLMRGGEVDARAVQREGTPQMEVLARLAERMLDGDTLAEDARITLDQGQARLAYSHTLPGIDVTITLSPEGCSTVVTPESVPPPARPSADRCLVMGLYPLDQTALVLTFDTSTEAHACLSDLPACTTGDAEVWIGDRPALAPGPALRPAALAALTGDGAALRLLGALDAQSEVLSLDAGPTFRFVLRAGQRQIVASDPFDPAAILHLSAETDTDVAIQFQSAPENPFWFAGRALRNPETALRCQSSRDCPEL